MDITTKFWKTVAGVNYVLPEIISLVANIADIFLDSTLKLYIVESACRNLYTEQECKSIKYDDEKNTAVQVKRFNKVNVWNHNKFVMRKWLFYCKDELAIDIFQNLAGRICDWYFSESGLTNLWLIFFRNWLHLIWCGIMWYLLSQCYLFYPYVDHGVTQQAKNILLSCVLDRAV